MTNKTTLLVKNKGVYKPSGDGGSAWGTRPPTSPCGSSSSVEVVYDDGSRMLVAARDVQWKRMAWWRLVELISDEGVEEHTGGSSSYYRVHVTLPTTSTNDPYTAECNDIIEALGMNFAEGNAFKAIWRIAAARQGRKKKGNNDVYDSEKIVFFGERMLAQARSK
jgi:hypothetical protein